MQVTLGFIRETEIDDCFYIRYVKASGYQVSCQEIVHISSLKLLNGIHSFLLSQVTLNLTGLKLEDFEKNEHSMALNLLIEEYYDSLLEMLHYQIQ